MIKLWLMQTLFLMIFILEHFNIQGKEPQCPGMPEIMNIQQLFLYTKNKRVFVFWFGFIAKILWVYICLFFTTLKNSCRSLETNSDVPVAWGTALLWEVDILGHHGQSLCFKLFGPHVGSEYAHISELLVSLKGYRL